MPTVVVVTAPFEPVARAAAAARGLADLPIVVFPAGFDDLGDDAVGALVAERMPLVLAALGAS